MKKIISLLSAVAVICSLMTTVVFADENHSIALVKKATEGNSITYGLVVKTTTTDKLRSITIEADINEAINGGVKCSGVATGAGQFNVDTTDWFSVLAIYTNPKGYDGTELELGTITFDFTDASIDSFNIGAGEYGFEILDRDTLAGKDIDITAKFTNDVFGATVSKPKAETTKYGTPITEGAYKGKTLYFNEAGATTFNFGTDKGIEITKTVGETSEKKVFGVKYLYDKGIEVENGGDATATFTIGIIDVNDLAKGTFSFRVLKSLE